MSDPHDLPARANLAQIGGSAHGPISAGVDWGRAGPRRLRRSTPPTAAPSRPLGGPTHRRRPRGHARAPGAHRAAGRAAGRDRAPSGLIVETLVAAGHPVVPIHPNVVKACRPRYRAAGGKSDPGDAYMLADILRTDGHRFRPLMPGIGRDQGPARPGAWPRRSRRRHGSPSPISSGACSRASGPAPWPSLPTSTARSPSPSSQRYPTPDSAARLGDKRLQVLPRPAPLFRPPQRRPSCSPACAPQPAGLAGDAEADAKGELVRALVGRARNPRHPRSPS